MKQPKLNQRDRCALLHRTESSGQPYQFFHPEYCDWIWKLIPPSSIQPNEFSIQHQGQISSKSHGAPSTRKWTDILSKWTNALIEHLLILHECVFFYAEWVECMLLAGKRETQGSWSLITQSFLFWIIVAEGLGLGTCVLLLRACSVNLSYSRQYTPQWSQVL